MTELHRQLLMERRRDPAENAFYALMAVGPEHWARIANMFNEQHKHGTARMVITP